MNYWLMKSEPSVFSIDDLRKVGTESWDGVRNYQARNYLRSMQEGDLAFFYHSSCQTPGIVGTMCITREAYPDHSAFNPDSEGFDASSHADNPRWFMVDVRYQKSFTKIIPLTLLRQQETLADLPLLRKGNRLSVMPVSRSCWECIIQLDETL